MQATGTSKGLLEKMDETIVQEKDSDSNVADDSKIPRQENDNMEPLTLNGKTTFILVVTYIFSF